MCVVSMVHDFYDDRFDKYFPIPVGFPTTETIPVNHPNQFTVSPPSVDLAELRQLIKEFKEAMAAAKVVDKLTGQPDCVDPEKAKLIERIENLEKELRKLKSKARRDKRING